MLIYNWTDSKNSASMYFLRPCYEIMYKQKSKDKTIIFLSFF